MLTPLREAYYFSRNQFQPLLMIALIYAVPSYLLELTHFFSATPGSATHLLLTLGMLCLNLLPFASAMLYIDALSHNRPISVGNAVATAFSKLLNLVLLNIVMGCMVAVGLILLVIPGIFLTYKLLFSELYLLLHQQSPMDALKSSYKATTGLAGELLPPIAIWFGATVALSLLTTGGLPTAPVQPIPLLIHDLLMMLLSIYGWALIYRLYQRYLEAEIPDPE